MKSPRWLLALPLVLAASGVPSAVHAATIRDDASLFSPKVVKEARTELDKIERESSLPVTIETIPSLGGEDIREVLTRHAKDSGAAGIYVLISRKEGKIDVDASKRFRSVLPQGRLVTIRDAFTDQFKKKDFDNGLLQGVRTIGLEAALARVGSPAAERAQPRTVPARPPVAPNRPMPQRGNGFGFGSLIGLGLLIVGVLFVVRLISSMMGGGMRQQGYGPGGPMGGPMGGPGYGGPGYGYGGGGRGGFFSGLMGGIGGALAGNWLYDQFSGRHQGGHVENTSYDPGTTADSGGNVDTGPDDWGGGGGAVGDWGGDSGGGGGDGGGDWGGGGGDWGGGGGDWGGGNDAGGGW